MKTMLRSVCLMTLAGVLAAPLLAADGEAAAPKKKAARQQQQQRQQGRARNMFRLPKSIALSEEQQAKVDALSKEYAPRMGELLKKSNEILTEDQQKARREAFRAAREAGKKGKDFRAAVDAAVQLTDEQKQTQKAVRAEMQKLMEEGRSKLAEILTADQREQLKKARESRPDGARPKKPKNNAT
ncbi:MAG: hypothetical protein KDA79_01205 [Planctomycetaceae bacterium]|nr:hypothetical protein [Planctomycetaceae bacterium]